MLADEPGNFPVIEAIADHSAYVSILARRLGYIDYLAGNPPQDMPAYYDQGIWKVPASAIRSGLLAIALKRAEYESEYTKFGKALTTAEGELNLRTIPQKFDLTAIKSLFISEINSST